MMPAKPDPSKTSTNKKAIDDIFKRKSTLKKSGEDRKSTLKTSGEDRKSTLKTSGEFGNLKNSKKHQLSKRVNDCENIFQSSTPGSSPSKHTTSGPRRRTLSTRFECSFTSSPLVSSVVFHGDHFFQCVNCTLFL
jgi:hypothetical protein